MNTKNKDKEYIMGSYGRFDVCIASGKGSTLYDEEGKEYIDFGSGIAVNSFGASDQIWKDAVCAQASKIQHTSNLYYSEPCATLAELLCEKTGMSKVFFSNSGAEANECAIKAARKYGNSKNPNKNIIITLKNSFHGRTITTLTATGQDVFHTDFGPFPKGFEYAEANNVCEIEKMAENENVTAIMIEIVQGEGGVNTLKPDFLKAIEKITTEKDILLVVDEVQTGNGRSGEMYAYMNFGITPDIVSTAKGLAGGLPMGATMFSKKLENILPSGTHGSTFGGNPICAAAAVSVVNRLDKDFLDKVKEKSNYIFGELKKIKGVKSVSGLGLMIGVETDKDSKTVANECLKSGLLVLTAKTKVRLLPALNITKEELDKGLSILKSVIEK